MSSLNPGDDAKQDLDDSGCVKDAPVNDKMYQGQVQLSDLSDDVLLCILKYLHPMDLKALGHTCSRFAAIVCDRTLWTRVDARCSPIGVERLRWLLTHCLNRATTELQITGYVSSDYRCLGIQDLEELSEGDMRVLRGVAGGPASGVDTENFLLRMWYPHLPRFAISPRWPDGVEVRQLILKEAEATKKSKQEDAKIESDMRLSSGTTPSSSSGLYSTSSEVVSKKDAKPGYDILRGCKGPQFSLTANLLKDLREKCLHLSTLSLEYCNINYKSTNIRNFPRKLKKLSLRGTRVYNLPQNASFLCKIQDRLPELEHLDVSLCDWFEPSSLMPLSKLPALEELLMRDCRRLTECVAYASLATRYGFRQLKLLDVTGSPLADSEISALGWLPLLEVLYCAPPADFQTSSEHTHAWNDTLGKFQELDSWELEEPDFYKFKSQEHSEPMEEELDNEEEAEANDHQEPNVQLGDIDDLVGIRDDDLLGNPWWSHERRIIVIHPNAERRLGELSPSLSPPLDPMLLDQPEPEPVNGQVEPEPRDGQAEPEPLDGQAEPEPLDGQAEPQPVNGQVEQDPRVGQAAELEPLDGHAEPEPVNGQAEQEPVNGQADPEPLDGEAEPELHDAQARPEPLGGEAEARLLDGHAQPGQLEGQADPGQGAGRAEPDQLDGPAQPEPLDGQAGPGPSKRPSSESFIDVVKRRCLSRTCGILDPVPAPVPVQIEPLIQAQIEPVIPAHIDPPVLAQIAPAILPQIPVLLDALPLGPILPPIGGRIHHNQIHPQLATIAAQLDAQFLASLPVAFTPQIPCPLIGHNRAQFPHNNPQQCPRLNNRPPVNEGAGTSRNEPHNDHYYRPLSDPYRLNDSPNRPRNDPQNRPRIDPHNRHRFVPYQRSSSVMHIDLDLHRNSTIHIGSHIGYHLVSDSAIMRFGRADNDNVNYVHIGQNGLHVGEEPGVRPRRSNLRVLSVRGYRNITDRSLQHLVTAAPHLRLIDFTQTSVSRRGVDVFKAVRPDCEVLFTDYEKK